MKENKFRNIMMKILYPNTFIFILFLIIGYGGVISVFLFNLTDHWISYVAYPLSAYALTITVAKVPAIYKKCYKFVDNIEFTHKLIHDVKYRSSLGLYVGVLFNVAYVVFKFIYSIIFHSLWMGANAIYYLVITIIRFILIKTHRQKADYKENLKKYNLTGFLLLLLNLTMMFMIFQMVVKNETFVYPGYLIYVTTLYSFYSIIVATANVVKYNHNDDPIFSSVKMLSLAMAVMSLFTTQTALITAFGEGDESFRLTMNNISGTSVIIIVVGIALFMIISSSKKLNELKKERKNGTN